MYEGRIPVLDVADYAAHLGRGGAVAQWIGGWGAISGEEAAIVGLDWTLRAVNSKKAPPAPKPPPSVMEAQYRARKNKSRQDRLRAAFRDYGK